MVRIFAKATILYRSGHVSRLLLGWSLEDRIRRNLDKSRHRGPGALVELQISDAKEGARFFIES